MELVSARPNGAAAAAVSPSIPPLVFARVAPSLFDRDSETHSRPLSYVRVTLEIAAGRRGSSVRDVRRSSNGATSVVSASCPPSPRRPLRPPRFQLNGTGVTQVRGISPTHLLWSAGSQPADKRVGHLNAVSDHGIDRSSGAPSWRSRALGPCGADACPGPRLVSGERRSRPRGAGPWPVWSLRPSRRRVDRATSMQVDETACTSIVPGRIPRYPSGPQLNGTEPRSEWRLTRGMALSYLHASGSRWGRPFGTWRSMVARLHGVQEVPGSNPGVPTPPPTPWCSSAMEGTKGFCFWGSPFTRHSVARPTTAPAPPVLRLRAHTPTPPRRARLSDRSRRSPNSTPDSTRRRPICLKRDVQRR